MSDVVVTSLIVTLGVVLGAGFGALAPTIAAISARKEAQAARLEAKAGRELAAATLVQAKEIHQAVNSNLDAVKADLATARDRVSNLVAIGEVQTARIEELLRQLGGA